MWRFTFGVALGVLGYWYWQQRPQREELESRMREFQSRGSRVLEESKRVLNETRGELSSALESGRESVQQKAERLRSAASGPTTPGTTGTSGTSRL